VPAAQHAINGIERASDRCQSCLPAGPGHTSVRVESDDLATSGRLFTRPPDAANVRRGVHRRQSRRVDGPGDNRLDVGMELGQRPMQRFHDRAQTTLMLRVLPTGIVPGAIGVVVEGDGHGASRFARIGCRS